MDPHFDALQVAHTLLRVAFPIYERAMDPVVRAAAQRAWGDAPVRDNELQTDIPRWLRECRKSVGFAVRPFVVEAREMDAYAISDIIKAHLAKFLPDAIRSDDAACETYRYATHTVTPDTEFRSPLTSMLACDGRDRVHNAAYLRDSLAHSPKPTIAECVAGVAAMREVVRAHSRAQSQLNSPAGN